MNLPRIGDGGMGTMLIRAGMKPGECAELWNIECRHDIEHIHRAYVEAGAEFVTTNTFGGSPLALARHGVSERTCRVNRAAVEIARHAGVMVMGDVGPFGDFLEPYGDTTLDELEASFRHQIRVLREAGADGIIVETMVDPNELAAAVRIAREFGDWPVFATYAFQKSGTEFRTMMGTTVAEAMKAAVEAGANAVGANCGTSLTLADYLGLATEIVWAAGAIPVIMQPNAGPPQGVQASPEEMAEWTRQARNVGVSIVGGCCGTTPDHVRAMGAV